MPIAVACQCGQKFQAKESLAGKRVKCPKCGRVLSIPKPQQQASPLDDPLDLGDISAFEQSSQPLGTSPMGAPGSSGVGGPLGPAPASSGLGSPLASPLGAPAWQGQAATQKGTKKGSRKKWIIIGSSGGGALIIAVIVVVILLSGKEDEPGVADNPNGSNPGLPAPGAPSIPGDPNGNPGAPKAEPPKRPQDYPALLSEAKMFQFSPGTFAVDVKYRFQDGERNKYNSFEIDIDLKPGPRGYMDKTSKLGESGNYRKIFAPPANTQSLNPAKEFEVTLRGSTSGFGGSHTTISAVATGNVLPAANTALDRTAFEFDREYAVRRTNATTGQSGWDQKLRGVKFNLHGRVSQVLGTSAILFGAHRQVRCDFETDVSGELKPGDDVVIEGKVGANSEKSVIITQCKVVGRDTECKIPRNQYTSMELALARSRDITDYWDRFGKYSNQILEVTGPVKEIGEKLGTPYIKLKAGDDSVQISLAKTPAEGTLKVGQMVTVDAACGDRLRGGKIIKVDVKANPADFEDPELQTTADLLTLIPLGDSTMVGKRVRFLGRVAKSLVDGKVVLTGDNQRTIVCQLPARPDKPLDVGDSYLLDGVVDANTDSSLSLKLCWVIDKFATAEELARAFATNPSGAAARFARREIRIAGKVIGWRPYLDSEYIILVDLEGTGNLRVQCHVPDKPSSERIKKMQRGESVVLRGDCRGLKDGVVSMAVCKLVDQMRLDAAGEK